MVLELKKCVICDGEIAGKVINWEVEVDGRKIIIPEVPVMECKKCGEKYLNPEASRYIDQEIERSKKGKLDLEVKIKEIREKKLLTQEELAKRMGFSISRLSEIERNKKTPSILLGLKLARALGCDVNELYRLR